jgi:hypothetical protein
VLRGKKLVRVIQTVDGKWVTTFAAKNWTRCVRCRKPDDSICYTEDGLPLCSICYYYKHIPRESFWKREGDYFFPYNIGRRGMDAPHPHRDPNFWRPS